MYPPLKNSTTHITISLGPETEVPYFLIPGKETKETVKIIARKIKPELTLVNDQNNPQIVNVLGSDIKVFSKIKMSQLDRKMIDLLCGCGGGICHLWLVGFWSFQFHISLYWQIFQFHTVNH